MDDLVRWLGEQLDEDKRVAWAWQDRRCDGCGTPVAARGVYGLVKCTACDPGDVPLTSDRVLREIEAKRQLLDDYTVTARIRDEASARIKAAGDHPAPKDIETWDRAEREAAILERPVKLAASPLDHRPGYREEWRP